MDVVHPRCAGIDCTKKDAKVCIRTQGHGRRAASATVTTWVATTSQILALREHLIAAKVSCVVIESTSDYWTPFYYLLDDGLAIVLVNAASVRNLPGRKASPVNLRRISTAAPLSVLKLRVQCSFQMST